MNKENNEKKTILIVEDDEMIAMYQSSLLEKYGYNVITVNTGEKSIDAVNNRNDIDLILMDINLGPGIDGTLAAQRILKEHHIPLIFISSHTDREIVEKTEGITSYGYIVKSSGETVIIASIKMAFRLYEAQQIAIQHEHKAKVHHESLITVLNNIKSIIYVSDMNTYEILFVNKFCEDKFGDVIGQKCWAALQKRESGPCPFCTNEKLLNKIGEPTGVFKWYHKNENINRWYECQDSAIKWIDGRLVRLEIAFDITERKNSEEKIKTLLQEKELLLRETHHRIKNNMNVINNILTIESIKQCNPVCKNILEDAANRVMSMMVLYDKLYKTNNFIDTNINDFLPSLIQGIINLFYNVNKVQTKLDIDDIYLKDKVLTSLGIIVNELLTNSMKYAFKENDDGIISISVKKENNDLLFIYQDNGTGLPDDFSLDKTTTFGLQLVHILVKKINGSIKIDKDNGIKYTIRFNDLC